VPRLALRVSLGWALLLGLAAPALAGPPYLTDDPEPTDYKHFEIYTFSQGLAAQGDLNGQAGVDFNYGAAPNLQLTATVPAGYDFPAIGSSSAGLSNIELAAKYRFLTQKNFGLDVAVFPRVFLPSAASGVGAPHAAYLFPIWLEKDWQNWSAFGGGGCEINRGGGAQDFCITGAVLARRIATNLQVGFELFHQTPDTQGGNPTTSIGAGVTYDVNENLHLLGYLGRGIQNAEATDRYNWYSAVLFTF
jgi:hypothetical protein